MKKNRFLQVAMEDSLFNESRKKSIDLGLDGVKHLVPLALEFFLAHHPIEKEEEEEDGQEPLVKFSFYDMGETQ